MIKEFNDSQPQVDYFREYTPDVVAALSNLGQTGGYYDANGHYARTQPFFGAFGVDGANQLTDRPPSQRFEGLQVANSRCPGARRAAGARRLGPVAGAGLQQPEHPARAMRRVATILVLMLVASAVTAVITTSSTGKAPTYRGPRDLRRRRVRGSRRGRAGRGGAGRVDPVARRCTKAPCHRARR